MHTRVQSQIEQVEEAVRAIVCGTPVVVWGGTPSAPGAAFVMSGDSVTAARLAMANEAARGGLTTVATTRDQLIDHGLRPQSVGHGQIALTVDPADTFGGASTTRAWAECVRRLAARTPDPRRFRTPGRIPVVVADSTHLGERTSHSDAAVGLTAAAGRGPLAAVTVLLDPSGAVASEAAATRTAMSRGLPLVRIDALQRWWRQRHRMVERTAEGHMQTVSGDFRTVVFRSLCNGPEHLALMVGDPERTALPLVHIHTGCRPLDAISPQGCDCGIRLDEALQAIMAEGPGVVLHLRGQDGVALHEWEALRSGRTPTPDVAHQTDERGGDDAAQMLVDLGIRTVRLLTDEDAVGAALEGHGIRVEERVSLRSLQTRTTAPHPPSTCDDDRRAPDHRSAADHGRSGPSPSDAPRPNVVLSR